MENVLLDLLNLILGGLLLQLVLLEVGEGGEVVQENFEGAGTDREEGEGRPKLQPHIWFKPKKSPRTSERMLGTLKNFDIDTVVEVVVFATGKQQQPHQHTVAASGYNPPNNTYTHKTWRVLALSLTNWWVVASDVVIIAPPGCLSRQFFCFIVQKVQKPIS